LKPIITSIEGMRELWNCCSSHWTRPTDNGIGTDRHRITSRNTVIVYRSHRQRMIARRRRFNIAARIAAIYDLFLGREKPNATSVIPEQYRHWRQLKHVYDDGCPVPGILPEQPCWRCGMPQDFRNHISPYGSFPSLLLVERTDPDAKPAAD